MVDLSDIDPAIREIVEELNSRGYRTVASCAGHPEKTDQSPEGEIVFAKKYPHRKIRQILKDFGVKVISVREIKSPWWPKPRTIVSFQTLGGPSIEVLMGDASEMRLPGREEAVDYFRKEGYSDRVAERLAKLTGYVSEEERKC